MFTKPQITTYTHTHKGVCKTPITTHTNTKVFTKPQITTYIHTKVFAKPQLQHTQMQRSLLNQQ